MYSSIPPQLRSSGLFCCWRYDQRKGKPTKVPYDPMTGLPAKSNDPTTFADFNTACSASHSYSGLGIGIFNGVSAIDLDDCITEDGKLTDTASEIVKLMHSYTEYSPSGKGLHILFTVGNFSYDKDRYYVMNHKSGIEVYVHAATNKYLTVTGRQVGNYPYGDRTKELTQLLERFMVRPNCGENGVNGVNPCKGSDSPALRRKPPSQYNDSLGLSDDELLQRAFRARNGQHFQQLWSGDTSAYGSHSEADFALCSNLAFWTQLTHEFEKRSREAQLSAPQRPAPRPGRPGHTGADTALPHRGERPQACSVNAERAASAPGHGPQTDRPRRLADRLEEAACELERRNQSQQTPRRHRQDLDR